MSDYFTKADAEEFKEELKRYLGILAEDFQHKLNFVIDAQEDIKRLIKTTNEETKKELRAEFKTGLKETEEKLRAEFRTGLKETEDKLRAEFRTGLKETEDRFRGILKETEEKLRAEFKGGLSKVEKEVSEIKTEIISHRDSTEIKQIKKKKRT
ncbi:MAG: hypothetical protein ACK4TF_00650 [Thermodesulfovibrionales bacterium]